MFCRYDSSCFHYILDEDQAWMAFYHFLQSWCPFWNGIWLGCPWQFTWSTYQKIGFCLHLVQFCLCSVSSQQVLFDWQLNTDWLDTLAEVLYNVKNRSLFITSKSSSKILSNSSVFVVFQTKCEIKCQFSECLFT